MNKQNKEITSNNLIRIKDEKVVDTLNEMYEKTKNTYQSKNKFFNDIIKLGVQVLQKQEKDNWAIQNEKQTLLDAIHEHTKRMNYFIKFSKPFIQTTYANSEVNQQLMCVILNYFFSKYEKNNLPKITYHELRHSCASLLLSKGVGMKEIQEWLGHSTYNTTADIYSHLSYSSKIGVANAINNVFGDKKKTTLEDNQLSEEDRKEKLESIVPVKVKSYSHRETTKTQEFDLSQVSPELKYEENMESDLDEELKELEELIKQRKQILKKKMDIEM